MKHTLTQIIQAVEKLPEFPEKSDTLKLLKMNQVGDHDPDPHFFRMTKEKALLFHEFDALKDKQKAIAGIKSDVYNAVDSTFGHIQKLFEFIKVSDLEKFKDDRIEKLNAEKDDLEIDIQMIEKSYDFFKTKYDRTEEERNQFRESLKTHHSSLNHANNKIRELELKLQKIPNWIKFLLRIE